MDGNQYKRMADEAERAAFKMREPMRSELLELVDKWRRLAQIADERDESDSADGSNDEPGQ